MLYQKLDGEASANVLVVKCAISYLSFQIVFVRLTLTCMKNTFSEEQTFPGIRML